MGPSGAFWVPNDGLSFNITAILDRRGGGAPPAGLPVRGIDFPVRGFYFPVRGLEPPKDPPQTRLKTPQDAPKTLQESSGAQGGEDPWGIQNPRTGK